MASKPHAKLEAWIWILIYGGMFALALGIAVARQDQTLGWIIGIPGVVVASVGAFLVYLRSRYKD
jgi:hypothetical protein